MTNTAAVYSPDESNQGNNTATQNTAITTSAALSVRKVDLTDPVNAGETLLYQIVVSNSGPSDAQNVVITDTLPVSTTLVGAGVGCSPAGNQVVCSAGTLAAGASQSFLIEVRVAAGAASNQILTNIVTATSPTSLAATATVTTTVQQPSGGQVDLVVAKSGDAHRRGRQPTGLHRGRHQQRALHRAGRDPGGCLAQWYNICCGNAQSRHM